MTFADPTLIERLNRDVVLCELGWFDPAKHPDRPTRFTYPEVGQPVAWERRMAHVTGVDISADAIAVAEQNARQLDLDNLRFVQGSWIEPVRELRYPVVVSNPPYVAEGDQALAALKREPVSALVAPENGLGCIRLLAEAVPAVLAEGGIFLFEHGADQAEAIDALLSDTGWTDVETFSDLAGLPRITRARRGS